MPKKNVVEELKAQKDGLDIWEDVVKWSKSGYDSINTEWWDLLKWYGLYRQKPNEGHFMLRIKIPSGRLTAEQTIEIGRMANQYARGFGDITTRQNIQLHWITIENAPTIVDRLKDLGLTTMGACGDIPRNIVGCPVAGIDPNEHHNALPEVMETHHRLVGNKAYSNLPRKFKLSISGCHLFCAQPQINDIGMVAFPTEDGRIMYGCFVGGGLSTKPYIAPDLGVVIPPAEVPEVCEGITALFRDHGYREKRTRARMKFLVDDWGVDKFRDTLEGILGRKLERYAPGIPIPPTANEDHLGVHEMKNGNCYIGCAVTRGRITGDQLIRIGELAGAFADGDVRNTCMQNFIIADVDPGKVEYVQNELRDLGLDPGLSYYRRNVISCTGTQFCNLAVSETKEFARDLVEYLEQKYPDGPNVRINVSGCPNACSQYQIGDIGLQGAYGKLNGEKVMAFWLFVGGQLGGEAALARNIAKGIPSVQIQDVLANLLDYYNADKQNGETFKAFVDRKSDEDLFASLQWEKEGR